MPTRHTISHADELYAGNAYLDGYSPDGRRGVEMSHLYAHEFLATDGDTVSLGDVDGILSSFANCSKFGATELGASGGPSVNVLSLCSGAMITAGSTILSFDLPRNLVWQVSGAKATHVVLNIHGTDQYDQPMAESLLGASQTVAVSGRRAFKSINRLYFTGATKAYATAFFNAAIIMSLGTGDRLGLPFHLANAGKLISLSANGYPIMPSLGNTSDAYEVYPGLDHSTTADTAVGASALDVRGTVRPIVPALATTVRYTALMKVDHRTKTQAFGATPPSSCTLAY